jgi:hypothetical protein
MNLRSRLKKLEQAVTDPSTTAQQEEGCICFPADQDLCFNSEESRAAEELRCPLHGQRIPAGVFITNRAAWRGARMAGAITALQYRRAMAATYDYSEARL